MYLSTYKMRVMEHTNQPSFPEQDHPSKLHGTHDDSAMKEKYIRDSGKIEDIPDGTNTPKMNAAEDESTHLTDRSGEEEKEDYINTDERKNDVVKRGL